MSRPVRTLLLWCPDWPVVAADLVDGVPAHTPVAVLAANRVYACSEAARAQGVRRGLRKREAHSRCPRLTVVAHDPARDARAFELVVAAVAEVAAGVAVLRPGACALAARGPARYFGGEERAAERIVEHVAQACAVESQVGIADGVFAAELAARSGRVVPPGHSGPFLAGLPVEALDRPRLTGLLRRLGVKTLGDFAALPAGQVLHRFGFDAALAHRLAAGQDARPLTLRHPPPDLEVTGDYDEPLERVDVAAFAARTLAEQLHERLTGHGLACTRLGIEAVTAHGRELHRVWRHDGLLTAAAVADRVRWQLDGWLSGAIRPLGGGAAAGLGPDPGRGAGSGIIRLRLVPDGIVRHAGLQPGLWGEAGEERQRAHRALHRIQGLLGPESVFTAVIGGGRSPADEARLVPWGDERAPARPGALAPLPVPSPGGPEARSAAPLAPAPAPPTALPAVPVGRPAAVPPPWPGRLPPPAPAVVLPEPRPAEVRDAAGRLVTVSARLEVSAPPARLAVDGGPPVEVTGWAGPWPVDERWWAPAEAHRAARFQLSLADGRALLLCLSAGRWTVAAWYD